MFFYIFGIFQPIPSLRLIYRSFLGTVVAVKLIMRMMNIPHQEMTRHTKHTKPQHRWGRDSQSTDNDHGINTNYKDMLSVCKCPMTKLKESRNGEFYGLLSDVKKKPRRLRWCRGRGKSGGMHMTRYSMPTSWRALLRSEQSLPPPSYVSFLSLPPLLKATAPASPFPPPHYSGAYIPISPEQSSQHVLRSFVIAPSSEKGS